MTTLKILLCAMVLVPAAVAAQDFYSQQTRAKWLKTAQEHTPKLIETEKKPTAVVKIISDPNAFQGYKAVLSGDLDSFYQTPFNKQPKNVVLDFGEHLTGYFSFILEALPRSVQDAPMRLKFTFGEVPSEVAVPYEPYSGTLSRAWLQDEIVTVGETPALITVPRRVSFRYVKIELLGSSDHFDFKFSDITFKATSSASAAAEPLKQGTNEMIRRIDEVGLNTLKECMQTVFEDGPKRDRRLWIGDLYLQAMSNNYSFKQQDLTKRCLYLLASVAQQDGYLYCNVFETNPPQPQYGIPFLFDYSLLYNALLKDYFAATNDRDTAEDLWKVAKRQTDNITRFLDKNGLFDAEQASKNGWWLFVDWNEKLDRQAALQGIMIFSMKKTVELASMLGRESEVSHLKGLIKKMSDGARKNLYDKNSGLFLSGKNKQISFASQAWMIMAGVATKEQARRALKKVVTVKDAVKPGGPYLYHYYVQALINSGLNQEAKDTVLSYWGGMVSKGADTFWEVYDPGNETLSPYNFYPVNSYCHAWSCTPVYFIRKYPEIFQE